MSKQKNKLNKEFKAVLIEMIAPKKPSLGFSMNDSPITSIPFFVLDETYEPIKMESTEVDLGFGTGDGPIESVVIRGTIEAKKMKELKKHPDVINIYEDTQLDHFTEAPQVDYPLTKESCNTKIATGKLNDVAAFIGVDHIWAQGFKGKGMVIGVVDGGISAKGRIPNGKIPRVIDGSSENDWGQISEWKNHGNMVANALLAIAPEAELHDIRIEGKGINGTISEAIRGFNWAIRKFEEEGTPQVLSNSWGLYRKSQDKEYATDPNHLLTRKVKEAIHKGILVLFAAGNCGDACGQINKCSTNIGQGKSIWGANGLEEVMTIGAANLKGDLIGYTSAGPAALAQKKPDFCGISHFKGYFPRIDTGTSAACPIVAGVVALLKQAFPHFDQHQIKNALHQTAKNLGPVGWDSFSGSGIIDAKAAFDFLKKQHTQVSNTIPNENSLR